MKHIKIVEQTLSQFDKIVAQLEKSEVALNDEIVIRQAEIAALLGAHKRAITARTNIQKITGA